MSDETEEARRLKRVEEAQEKLRRRIQELEAENARLRQSVTAGAAR